MKQKDILQKLTEAGFTYKDGRKHIHILKNGNYVSAVSRQKEIDNKTVRKIEKQTRVKLLK